LAGRVDLRLRLVSAEEKTNDGFYQGRKARGFGPQRPHGDGGVRVQSDGADVPGWAVFFRDQSRPREGREMKQLWDALQLHFKERNFVLVQVERVKKNVISVRFRSGPTSFWTLEVDEVELAPGNILPPGMTNADLLDAALLANAKVALEKWEIERGKPIS